MLANGDDAVNVGVPVVEERAVVLVLRAPGAGRATRSIFDSGRVDFEPEETHGKCPEGGSLRDSPPALA
jgi:hypothetical protein